MNEPIAYPTDYIAFDKLTVCSNVLIGGGVIARLEGHYPVLVGRGLEAPFIWLSGTKDGKEWQPVIEKNIPRNPHFTVTLPPNDKQSVIVAVAGNRLVVLAKQISPTEAEVMVLDLSPLGIDIHGFPDGLRVKNNMLSHNTFQGGPGMAMIG